MAGLVISSFLFLFLFLSASARSSDDYPLGWRVDVEVEAVFRDAVGETELVVILDGDLARLRTYQYGIGRTF